MTTNHGTTPTGSTDWADVARDLLDLPPAGYPILFSWNWYQNGRIVIGNGKRYTRSEREQWVRAFINAHPYRLLSPYAVWDSARFIDPVPSLNRCISNGDTETALGAA